MYTNVLLPPKVEIDSPVIQDFTLALNNKVSFGGIRVVNRVGPSHLRKKLLLPLEKSGQLSSSSSIIYKPSLRYIWLMVYKVS